MLVSKHSSNLDYVVNLDMLLILRFEIWRKEDQLLFITFVLQSFLLELVIELRKPEIVVYTFFPHMIFI